MNLQEYVASTGTSVLGNIIYAATVAIFLFLGSRINAATLLGKYSLRTRLTIAISLGFAAAALAIRLNVNPYLAMGVTFVALVTIVQVVLAELSKVGILNAFSSTRGGISAESSLRRVEKELVFLGIGGKKLTDSPEFEKALRRCKSTGGSASFLLSNPDNPALSKLAKSNQKDHLAYALRVHESLREIVNKCELVGVSYKIRLYRLESELALPHFRLMFIDNRVCLFSHLVWNEQEGLDNPQLIIRSNSSRRPNSLYSAFKKYFDELWAENAENEINKTNIESV